jgi:hypothetical protein
VDKGSQVKTSNEQVATLDDNEPIDAVELQVLETGK